jgi:hypothetical protein
VFSTQAVEISHDDAALWSKAIQLKYVMRQLRELLAIIEHVAVMTDERWKQKSNLGMPR